MCQPLSLIVAFALRNTVKTCATGGNTEFLPSYTDGDTVIVIRLSDVAERFKRQLERGWEYCCYWELRQSTTRWRRNEWEIWHYERRRVMTFELGLNWEVIVRQYMTRYDVVHMSCTNTGCRERYLLHRVLGTVEVPLKHNSKWIVTVDLRCVFLNTEFVWYI